MITQKIIGIIGIMFIAGSLFTFSINANPQGASNVTVSSSGSNSASTAPVQIDAKAGNVTAIVVHAIRNTEAWQGYYGNITGRIVLDDGDNFTLYDWNLPNPTGEIYASNGSSVSWINIFCLNASQFDSSIRPGNVSSAINMTLLELRFGINLTDNDGINETFNDTYTDANGFRVGNTNINVEDGCSSVHPYTSEAYNIDWQELMLTDNSSIIFTAVLRNDAYSYQPGSQNTADFQMLVLENGHYGQEDTTTQYYFYVEMS